MENGELRMKSKLSNQIKYGLRAQIENGKWRIENEK